MNQNQTGFSCPYFMQATNNSANSVCNICSAYPCSFHSNQVFSMYPDYTTQRVVSYVNAPQAAVPASAALDTPMGDPALVLRDFGSDPLVLDIRQATKENTNFRTTIWTGEYMQLTLLNIPIGSDFGLEVHPELDQFFCIEAGQGFAICGDRPDNLDFQQKIQEGSIFIVPAGKWHNVINTGNTPLKLFTIYAPRHHLFGTIHESRSIAEQNRENNP